MFVIGATVGQRCNTFDLSGSTYLIIHLGPYTSSYT